MLREKMEEEKEATEEPYKQVCLLIDPSFCSISVILDLISLFVYLFVLFWLT
jgi:hypothetical protein